MALGFRLDLNRCTGCAACGIACSIENELEPGTSWRQVVTFNEARVPSAPQHHLSLACNHCADAPCMAGCPALAFTRDPATGAVAIDPGRCIGCGYCTWTCPYDAPRLDPATSVMTKCTFCSHRLADGLDPACVTACPTEALGYGDLETLGGVSRVPGFPETGARPAMRFVPLRAGGAPVSSLVGLGRNGSGPDPDVPGGSPSSGSPAAVSGIGLASEWPLLVFTLIAAVLVGWQASWMLTGVTGNPFVFLGGAVLAVGVSTAHLGRPLRAWRAMLNVRSSWLSREIAGFSGFVAFAVLFLATGEAGFGWAAAVLGFASLFAVDRVYDVVRRSGRIHSADVLLTGVLLAGALAGNAVVAIAAVLVKAMLYGHRWMTSRHHGPTDVLLSAARKLIGFAVPAAIWIASGESGLLVAGCVVIGEIIDRAAFYDGLGRRTPRDQAVRDLRAWSG